MPRPQQRRRQSASSITMPQARRRGNPVAAASAVQPLTPSGTNTLQPQYGVPFRGRYPGQNLYGDNSTPASAYNDAARHPDPGLPVFPPGDPVRQIPGIGLRQWGYPVGVNIAPIPRGTEAVPFPVLKGLSRSYYGIGLCKRAFFRIMQRLDLTFAPRPELVAGQDATADKWLTPALKMRDWFVDGPSKRGNADLASWLKAVINDLLELDAVGIWPEPTRAGRLYALRYISGDTIQCLEDLSGSTPRPPAPAYRQVVYGAPGIMLTVPTSDGKVTESQLDYLKMVTRTDGPYGLPPVEDMILTVNQALRKQGYDLRRYTDGATPEGIVTTNNSELFDLMPDQVLVYEQMWNSILAGNDALKVRTKFLQPGFQFTSTKQQEIATEFDSFLLSIAIAMFGLTKDEVSFTETSNRAVGSSQENVTYRNAVKPTSDFIASYFTRLCRRYDGQPLSVVDATISTPGSPTRSKMGTWDARFVAKWHGIEEQDDWNKKASTYIALKNAGIIGPTKVQRLLGMPLDPGEPEVPAYQIAQGGMQSVVIVPDLAEHRDAMQDANNAALEAKTASSEQVTEAMKNGGAGMGGQSGQPGAPMNPVAAQALAAGKPQAAAQAANGGAAPGQAPAQTQSTQKAPAPAAQAPQGGTVPQKAAAQQLGAKVASAATGGAAQGAKRNDASEEAEELSYGRDEYRVSGDSGRAALALDPDDVRAVSGGEPDRDGDDGVWAGGAPAGDDGGAPGVPALPGTARGDAPDRRATATGGAGSGSNGSREAAGTAGEPAILARETAGRVDSGHTTGSGNADSASRNIDPRSSASAIGASHRGTDGGNCASASAQASTPDYPRGASGSGSSEEASDQETDSQEARSEDWRRWHERARKAVRTGKRIAPFTSDHIPATLHAWVSERLALASTADDVRAIFAEAREREEREEVLPDGAPSVLAPAEAPTTPDPLARFLDAFTAHMEAQTAKVRAEHAEQLRELRTQVLSALSA